MNLIYKTKTDMFYVCVDIENKFMVTKGKRDGTEG